MKRIATWVVSTVTVVVLLFGYHTSTEGAQSSAGAVVVSAPAPSPSAAGSAASGSSSGGKATTVLGAVASTRWGPVQVQITTDGTKITEVTVPRYPNGNPKDQQINARALPILVQETVGKQTANIDMVSGATVTSAGYLQSLQSAIDEANL